MWVQSERLGTFLGGESEHLADVSTVYKLRYISLDKRVYRLLATIPTNQSVICVS